MSRHTLSVTGILICLLLMLVSPCLASDRQVSAAASSAPGTAVTLTAAAGSTTEEVSDEEEPLPARYEPEQARIYIGVTALVVLIAVIAAAILIRRYKGY